MQHKNKITVMLSATAFVLLGLAATKPSTNSPFILKTAADTIPKRNLLVLPANISNRALDSIMHTYNKALGIKCNFCHAPQKNNKNELDFVSDEKPEKEITRQMMRMTNDINKKYFNFGNAENTDDIQAVTCITCHRGEPHP